MFFFLFRNNIYLWPPFNDHKKFHYSGDNAVGTAFINKTTVGGNTYYLPVFITPILPHLYCLSLDYNGPQFLWSKFITVLRFRTLVLFMLYNHENYCKQLSTVTFYDTTEQFIKNASYAWDLQSYSYNYTVYKRNRNNESFKAFCVAFPSALRYWNSVCHFTETICEIKMNKKVTGFCSVY